MEPLLRALRLPAVHGRSPLLVTVYYLAALLMIAATATIFGLAAFDSLGAQSWPRWVTIASGVVLTTSFTGVVHLAFVIARTRRDGVFMSSAALVMVSYALAAAVAAMGALEALDGNLLGLAGPAWLLLIPFYHQFHRQFPATTDKPGENFAPSGSPGDS